jgi:Protein of unknown function (DUF2815)
MPMKDSRMTDAWLTDVVARYPTVVLPDGTIRTCPVRLVWTDSLLTTKKRKNDDGEEKEGYDATLHFPPQANTQIAEVIYPVWLALCREKHGRMFDANGNPQGLHWPFHDGAIKPQYSGYTAGAYYVSCGSQYKPSVVDPARNPIVDPSRVYPGVWAICGLNSYPYSNKKKGAGFGLQTVMLIADDTKLGGGGPDVNKVYEGITIDAAFNPAAAFGPKPGGPPGAPGNIVPFSPPPALDYDPAA